MTVEWRGPVPYMADGRQGTTIDRIVLHTTTTTIEGADSTFHGSTRQVSAHYGVAEDGRIWQWVQEKDTAFQAGDFPMNLRSIGIEHEDKGDFNGVRPDLLYTTAAALLADVCKRNVIPIDRTHILDHRQVSSTSCPDALDTDRIVREAAALEDQLSQVEVDTINAHTDAKFTELYSVLEAVTRRQMRGADTFTPGHDTPIASGEQINPSNGRA